MDVGKLIECLEIGDLVGSMQYIPKLYHETLDLQQRLPADWKYHGTGFYSCVIGKVDSDKVWKISWKGRDPWIKYAEYVVTRRQNPNPLLPQIFDLVIQDGRAIASMERLQDSNIWHSVGMLDVVRLCKQRTFTTRFTTEKAKRRKAREYLRYGFDMRGNQSYNPTNLAEIVVWMAGLPDAKVDCHGRNWMVRSTGQLVLTDPIG